MRVLIALALVASAYAVVNDCKEISIHDHAQAPSFVGGTGKFDSGNLHLTFNVDCAFHTQSTAPIQGAAVTATITASREFKVGGTVATENGGYVVSTTAATRANGNVEIKVPWSGVTTQAITLADTAFTVEDSQSRVLGFTVQFTGTTNHMGEYEATPGGTVQLANPDLGASDMTREIVEIYRFQCRFKATVQVSASVVFKYSAIDYQATLNGVRTSLSTNADVSNQDLYIEMIIRTMVKAPFKIVIGGAGFTSSLTKSGTAKSLLASMTVGTQTINKGDEIASSPNCQGPYSAYSSLANKYATHKTTGANAPICWQDFHFAVKLNLISGSDCDLNGYTLSISDTDGGVVCGDNNPGSTLVSGATWQVGDAEGSAYDESYTCPIPATPGDVDDFAAQFVITTSNACPSLVLETDAIAAIRVTKGDLSAEPNLKVNQDFNLLVYGGVADATNTDSSANLDNANGLFLKSMSVDTAGVTEDTTGGTTHCVAGSCNKTWTTANFEAFGGACAKNTMPVGGIAYDCAQKLKVNEKADTNMFQLVNPKSGRVVTLTFSATVAVVIEDGNGGFSRKHTIDVATKKSDFFSLLQDGETTEGEVQAIAEGSFSIPADVEEVEEVQTAPETATEEELFIAEETSSNLVYIVVGVLLALSVAIAAVVMYMRRVKGSKKAQPVVPVPITIETQGSSTTA